ncbi:MAG: acetyltransferase [Eubacteriales bacterium]|nr:acetyltransferase [Eubacteriales bacterium]
MLKKLLLIGGGGHCKSVLDSLLPTREYSEIGIIEKSAEIGDSIFGIPIIGVDEDLPRLFRQGYKNAFFAVGSTANPTMRVKFFQELKDYGFQIPNIIDPSAAVSPYAKLGRGVFVGKNAVINADVEIGNGTIINTAAIIEYECRIGNFVHIAPTAVLTGAVEVGDYTHIGTGCIVKKKVSIGSYAMIGAGVVVANNIRDGMIVSLGG